jgi:hypothetical protein
LAASYTVPAVECSAWEEVHHPAPLFLESAEPEKTKPPVGHSGARHFHEARIVVPPTLLALADEVIE